MILIEYTTKSGSLYTANPISKKIKKAGTDEWAPFKELLQGHVGESLQIVWPDDRMTTTTKIVELSFPEVND